MKIIFWNCRGFGSSNTRLVLKKFCSLRKPDLIFIAEPMIHIDDVPPSYWTKLKVKPSVVICCLICGAYAALPSLLW